MPAIPPYFQQEALGVSQAHPAPSPATLPIRRHAFKAPKIRVHLDELAHEGSSIFLSNVKGNEDIDAQVQNVLNLLYTADDKIPGTRSVTFVLRPMDGVAYTTGTELDSDHKEIHLSLQYITAVRSAPREEILGVICHELVHCFQYNALGTCPGGLIEGIADYVRLRAGLAAKHWRQEAEGSWDAGYQHTGYFLDYLERRFGDGTVRSINAGLKGKKYDEKSLFKTCCKGKEVGELWDDYKKELESTRSEGGSEEEDAPAPVPTHAAQSS